MAKTDMSPRAVTVRLIRTAQLRRLCLELGQGRNQTEPFLPIVVLVTEEMLTEKNPCS